MTKLLSALIAGVFAVATITPVIAADTPAVEKKSEKSKADDKKAEKSKSDKAVKKEEKK